VPSYSTGSDQNVASLTAFEEKIQQNQWAADFAQRDPGPDRPRSRQI